MPPLTEQDRTELIRLLQAGEQIPANWRTKLFPGGPQSVEIGKEYRLEYADPPFATRQDFMKNEGNQYERGRFLKNVTPQPQNITTLGMLERFQNV